MLLSNVDMFNGFGNRFLWFCVSRSKKLPRGGGDFDIAKEKFLISEITEAINFSKIIGKVDMDKEIWILWDYAYDLFSDFSEEQDEFLVAMTGRIEPYARMLSVIYALLDQSRTVFPHHLLAALAILDYSVDSLGHIFQKSTGDPVADKILNGLKNTPSGLTSTDIYNVFKRHKSERIDIALNDLIQSNRIKKSLHQTSGRTATLYTLNALNAQNNSSNFLQKVKHFAIKNGINIAHKAHEVSSRNNNKQDHTPSFQKTLGNITLEPCTICKSRRFWRQGVKNVLCVICHPPVSEKDVLEWIEV